MPASLRGGSGQANGFIRRKEGSRVFSCPWAPAARGLQANTLSASGQRQTQVLDLPRAAMIALVPSPSPLKRTIRARQTYFCGTGRAATIASRRRRSSAVTVNEIPLRIRQTRIIAKVWNPYSDSCVTCNPLAGLLPSNPEAGRGSRTGRGSGPLTASGVHTAEGHAVDRHAKLTPILG